MGVPSVIPLIKNNPSLWESRPFRDMDIVVDGNCLLHYLVKHLQIDAVGNYVMYSEKVETLFRWFSYCNVKAYVVLDGAYEQDNRKLNTVINRAKQRIQNPKDYAPILVHLAFKNVLQRLNIDFVKCDFEADRDIQILANDLQCPVLSFDSDFYVFDVKFGYIPFNELPFEDIFRNIEFHYTNVDVHVYFRERLFIKLPYLKGNMALLATALGNDYLSKESGVLQRFYRSDNFKLPRWFKEDIFEMESDRFCKIIRSVLYWISRCKDVERGRRQFLPFCNDKNDKNLVSVSLEAFSEKNEYTKFNLKEFLCGRLPCETHLLAWYTHYHRNAKIPNFVMNTLIHKRVIFNCQLEGTNDISSHECSVSLRQVMYAICLGTNTTVIEYDRTRNTLCQKERTGIASILGMLTGLGRFNTISDSRKSQILAASFCCPLPSDNIFTVWNPFSIYLMIIAYWIRVTGIDIHFVRSAVIVMINLAVKRGEITDTMAEKNIVDVSNEFTTRQFSKTEGIVYDSSILYGFAQLQSCFYFGSYLNALLDTPVKNVDPGFVFSGRDLHNVCYALKRNDDTFFKENIGSEKIAACLNEILSFLENNVYIP